jgi:hypothetical protein
MGKRVITASAVVALGCVLLSSCDAASDQLTQGTQSTPTSRTAVKAEQEAVQALQAWLADPVGGTITVSSVEFEPNLKTEVARELTGSLDPGTQSTSLSGTSTLLSNGSTNQTQLQAVESVGQLYTSIPPTQLDDYPGKHWLGMTLAAYGPDGPTPSAPTRTPSPSLTPSLMPTPSPTPSGTPLPGQTSTTGPGAGQPPTETLWVRALESLGSVTIDGPSEVNTKSAIEFTGTVDLSAIPGIPQSAFDSPVFKQAGTTEASIDLYTDLSTMALVRLTYRIGLDVSVDSTATQTSTAGYEVDLSGFGQPPATGTPSIEVPAAQDVVRGGNDDLCYLLPF